MQFIRHLTKYRHLILIYLLGIFISCNEPDYQKLSIDECINNFETLKSKTSLKGIQLIKYWWKDNQDIVVIKKTQEWFSVFRYRNGIYSVDSSSLFNLNTTNKNALIQELQWIQDTLKVRSFSINRKDSSSRVEFVIDNIDIKNLTKCCLKSSMFKNISDTLSVQQYCQFDPNHWMLFISDEKNFIPDWLYAGRYFHKYFKYGKYWVIVCKVYQN